MFFLVEFFTSVLCCRFGLFSVIDICFRLAILTTLQGPRSAAPIQKKTQDSVNRADAAEVDCIICCENTATVTFQPCGHKITCTGTTGLFTFLSC